ncbi:ATP-binding protein [Pseudophaeobacter sp. A-200-2]|uniref:ATP-binding protein n=1 Tax=Pseudophaeobacter sp. A-200-2 TaxID=3098145 RepID=UPI0034D45C5D
MTQEIIAFTGISGVGKTTFLRRLRGRIPFQHLTGGSLISKARETPQADRDSIRISNLDENQRLLVQGFKQERDPAEKLVIMDGHVIIDTAEGICDIPTEVFECLGVNLMVHLDADPATIVKNRAGDKERKRPVYSADVVFEHQERSRMRAKTIATELGIKFVGVTHEDMNALLEYLK